MERVIDCALAAALLPNYLDDELTEELAEQVQAHLIGCRQCAWEVESLRQATAALQASAAEAEPSATLRECLIRRLLQDHRAAQSNRPHAASRRYYGTPQVVELRRKESEHGR